MDSLKIDTKLDFMKIKIFCARNAMKRVKTEWEKIFINNMSDKGPVPRICKQLLQLNNKDKQPNLKMGKGLE